MAHLTPSTRFDPRPREGGDGRLRSVAFGPLEVSIHAPGKGATSFIAWSGTICRSFDPRPREGGDFAMPSRRRTDGRFDPRPREGGDSDVKSLLADLVSFRSTPPGRGRHCSSRRARRSWCFDPRPREGGDDQVLSQARVI